MRTLGGWQNFYVIMGSSAGALIGLQFVVLSLVASKPTVRVDPQTGSAFATPTIIHFSTVLTLAAILCAPWQAIDSAAVLCGALGVGGVVYGISVALKVRSQTSYRPVLEDWMFHTILPLVAYLTLAVSGFAARAMPRESLFGVAASALVLLFVGIHNAWDTVTYHVFVVRQREHKPDSAPPSPPADS